MTDRQFKKYLKKHPALVDGLFVVSLAEANKILLDAPMPTFEEMIELTKKRFPQYTSEQWMIFDRVIERDRTRVKREKRISQLITDKACFYKFAAAGFVAAIILFFALIPAGRALAKEIYNYIINVFGNTAAITQLAPDESSESPETDRPVVSEAEPDKQIIYASLEAFRKQTGLKPFELHADWLTIESISGDYSPEFGHTLWINYVDREGNWIRLSQEWFTGQEMYVSTEDAAFESVTIRDAAVLYYGIDPNDNCFGGFVMLDESFLFIGADSDVNIELLFDALK